MLLRLVIYIAVSKEKKGQNNNDSNCCLSNLKINDFLFSLSFSKFYEKMTH